MSAGSKGLCQFGFAAAIAMMLAGAPSSAQTPQSPSPPQQPPPQAQQTLTQQQLQQLVAPIALYPDALLAQVLTASTYPLEVAMAAAGPKKIRTSKAPHSRMSCKSSLGMQASKD
jgi:hypothetical protein